MRKIVPSNFRRRRESCGNDVAYVLRTPEASRDRIEVTGILMTDGRGCGSRENFSVTSG